MPGSRRLTLALALALVPLAAPALAASTEAPAGLESELAAALASHDAGKLRSCFADLTTPAWREAAGLLAQGGGREVAFRPYFQTGDRTAGRLVLSAGPQQRSFDVVLWKRGSRWLVGEALDLRHQDARVLRHDLRLDLRSGVAGEDLLTLEPAGPSRRVFLRLDPALAVQAVEGPSGRLGFVRQDEVLYFERPAADGAVEVRVKYAGALRGSSPAGTFLPPGDWYPRPFGTEAAIFRTRLAVPVGWQAVGVGAAEGVDRFADRWVHQWTTPGPVEGVACIAGRLAMLGHVSDGVEVVAYAPWPADGQRPWREVRPRGDAAASALADLSAALGPFPHPRWSLVAAEADMRLPGLQAFGPASWARAGDTVTFGLAAARQWTHAPSYSGSVGERAFLAEGLAGVFALAHVGRVEGKAGRSRALAAWRAAAAALRAKDERPIERAGADVAGVQGALVLNMLRERLGPAAFNAGVAEFLRGAGAGGHASDVAGLRRSLEQAGNKPLGSFFRHWLARRTLPTLRMEGLTARGLPGGAVELYGTLVQTEPAFPLELPLVVAAERGETRARLNSEKARTPFRLRLSGRPSRVTLDPDGDVLFEGPRSFVFR